MLFRFYTLVINELCAVIDGRNSGSVEVVDSLFESLAIYYR